ncbi:MAG TPA: hypothetical protein VK658_27395 [Chryseolinea sp.]|nr:hypothetical protein [Chryseolinea sp.]
MKNLPDDELFSKLKSRLQNFEEPPDEDVWDAIAIGVSKTEPRWIRSIERSALLLSALLMFGTWYTLGTQPEIQPSLLQKSSAAKIPYTVNRRISSSSPGVSDSKAVDSRTGDRPTAIKGTRSRIQPAEKTNGMARHEVMSAANALTTEAMGEGHSTVSGQREPVAVVDSAFLPAIIQSTAVRSDSSSQEPRTVATHSRKVQGRLHAYGVATPSLTFLHVDPSTSDDVAFDRLNSPGILSKERISLSFEGGVQFSISRRLVAFTGLTYYQQSMEFSLEQFTTGTGSYTPNHSLDFSFEPNTATATVNYRLQNIGVMAGVLYVVSTGKIVHQLGASLQYEYGLLQPAVESDRSSTQNYLNYRIMYRAAYKLNERLSVFVQPSFARSLLYDDLLDGALRVNQSRAGIGVGMLYRLR